MIRKLFHAFSTFAMGGPQRRFITVANALGGGYHHSIHAMDGNYDAAQHLAESVDFTLRADIQLQKRNTIRNVLACRSFLRTEEPDLLVTSNWGSIEWALANTPRFTPQIHMEDGFGPDEAHSQLLRRVWTRRLALQDKKLVVASDTLARIAREQWKLTDQLHVLKNGVSLERFGAPAGDALAGSLRSAGAPAIGTVSVLRPEKRLDRLIDAFLLARAETPCRLAIVGDGPEHERLKRHAERSGLADQIIFTGAVKDPADILPAFDLFAITSDTEQAPISLLEAMAAGLPIVATDVGDIGNMVSPDNRPFIVPRSPPELAKAFVALLTSDEKRRALAVSNRERAATDFSEARMIEEWRRLWDGETAA